MKNNIKSNVLLLVVDSLNANKCSSKTKTTKTPNIDRLLNIGTNFKQCITSSSNTTPSISSMLTSKFAFECMTDKKDLYILDKKQPNFIDIFKKSGFNVMTTYKTLLPFLNLDTKINSSNSNNYRVTRKGLAEMIISDLEQIKNNEPWFYYIHLHDLHESDAYLSSDDPEELFRDEYGKNQYERIVSSIDVWIGKFLEKIDLDNTLVILTADHGTINANFTKELEDYNQNFNTRQSTTLKIAQKATSKTPGILKPLKKKVSNYYLKNKTDSKKKNIENELNKLDSQNITPYEKRIKRTILLGESNVYDERFCVPLIFTGSGVPSGKTIPYQVRSVDIFPTIADIVGIPQIDNIRGKSLIPMFNDEENNDRPAFIESATNSPKSKSSDVVGMRTPTHKYFRDRNDSSKKIHLYDLKNDPLEEYNIANDNSEIIEKMEKMLQDIQGENGFRFGEANALTKEESEDAIKVLKELGYL